MQSTNITMHNLFILLLIAVIGHYVKCQLFDYCILYE
ncbi:hypothetical protein barba126A_phanotate67 [Rheinheimera phage vB_RspM_barba_12-6A]|uniref:Uncharacterized protein n=1 Tax=Rheinheimera phage vB_RspM_barba_12-8C TaxID=2743883 RepID=A0A7G9VMD0_9CAUD|nr:hypothetical protein barba109A_phanotate18 [Rheinheimera phage vB_RspM_barba_10-9A]QNO02176.1 hypothetical protein barba109B_phanotate18 [Rheinheimera phage vB_RspM_barba_10-9B]QNO02475.1 hypothetical protein barba109C_phanotate154 [Rheinheimera phage vB_RspM_barba_10-9C]QNO02495.1 hypothetical protein barba109D_phanotate11 [Rheinheimera phage vB_RspM_barba_10-9D]QNO02730.1 hypothetical protein barba109E_phanotate82 [Rheinheimera phage vB_RspM_barba_10-9E]QNO02824.1 hypothetical protein bar